MRAEVCPIQVRMTVDGGQAAGSVRVLVQKTIQSTSKRSIAYINSALFETRPPVYWTLLLREIERSVEQRGYHLHIYEDLHSDIFQIDGAVLLCADLERTLRIGGEIIRSLPCLSLLTAAPGFTSVTVDDHASAAQAVEFLRSHGHTNIGYLHTANPLGIALERLQGYRQAMEAAGIKLPEKWCRQIDYVSGSSTSNHAAFYTRSKELMHDWLASDWDEDGMTALIVQNEPMADGVFLAVSDQGLGCPGEISLISFDGQFDSDPTMSCMTTIVPPFGQIAEEAVSQLISLIEQHTSAIAVQPKTIAVPANLMIGDTTGPVKPYRFPNSIIIE
jgi:DNA-binding LacI/PurR family transcriptional regulator